MTTPIPFAMLGDKIFQLDPGAIQRPDIAVVPDPQGVRLSMAVMPARDGADRLWAEYVQRVWAQRRGALRDLEQCASVLGPDLVLPKTKSEGGQP